MIHSVINSFFMLPAIILALLLLVVAGVVSIKSGAKGGREDVVKKVYIYLVLFVTLMMTIGGSVAVFTAVADIIAPTPYYQSFEEYKMGVERPYTYNGVTETTKLSEEELRKRYEDMVLTQKENQINRAKNSLIKSLGWIAIPLPVFIYFQRRLARENFSKNNDE